MAAEAHILFADDNPDIRELVQVLLHGAGFRVSAVADPAAVLELVATKNFDAVVLDYWMPQVTGLDLCRRIRAVDQKTPILICSGGLTRADREAVALAGAQGYLAKPFNAGDLIRALRAVIVT